REGSPPGSVPTTTMDEIWRIELLGGLRAVQGERVLARFRTHKAGALLAYMAFYPEQPHSRDVLLGLFWPECSSRAGRRNLRVEIASLRRQLESPAVAGSVVLQGDNTSLRLNPAAHVTDVSQFEAALAAAACSPSDTERAERLAQAVELYRGELLPGYYEEWVLQERLRLAEQFQRALTQLIALREKEG